MSKLTARLPTYVAEYAIKAGLPLAEAKTFVETFLTVPAEAAKIPGVTAEVLAAAAKGSQWAYAESLHYVWYVPQRSERKSDIWDTMLTLRKVCEHPLRSLCHYRRRFLAEYQEVPDQQNRRPTVGYRAGGGR